MVIVPSLGLSGALIKGGIAEMMRLSIDPEIKSARRKYRDLWIGIISILHKSSQLCKQKI